MYSQHKACMIIEDFVKNAVEGKEIDRAKSDQVFEELSRCFFMLSENSYTMNTYLSIFYNLFQPLCFLSKYEHLNNLTRKIRVRFSQRSMSTLIAKAETAATIRSEKIKNYISAMAVANKRLLVVRLDLHYKEKSNVSIDKLYYDLNYFISRLSSMRFNNNLTKGMLGYVWRIEQGVERGFHIHTAFFFNPRIVRSDYYKADSLGKLWGRVTRGNGYFYNCNANLSNYKNVGIGVVDCTDLEKIHNMVSALGYLGKISQELRIKPKNMRVFGSSGYKKAALLACRLNC